MKPIQSLEGNVDCKITCMLLLDTVDKSGKCYRSKSMAINNEINRKKILRGKKGDYVSICMRQFFGEKKREKDYDCKGNKSFKWYRESKEV